MVKRPPSPLNNHVHVVKPDHVQGRYQKVHHKLCAYKYGTIKFGSFLRWYGTVRENKLGNIQVTGHVTFYKCFK